MKKTKQHQPPTLVNRHPNEWIEHCIKSQAADMFAGGCYVLFTHHQAYIMPTEWSATDARIIEYHENLQYGVYEEFFEETRRQSTLEKAPTLVNQHPDKDIQQMAIDYAKERNPTGCHVLFGHSFAFIMPFDWSKGTSQIMSYPGAIVNFKTAPFDWSRGNSKMRGYPAFWPDKLPTPEEANSKINYN